MRHARRSTPAIKTFWFYLLVLAAAFTSIVTMAFVKGASQATQQPEKAVKLAKSGLHFALDLYKQCCVESDDNFFVSPYSISVALAMTFAGARETTASQMREIMKLDMIGEDSLVHEAFKSSVDLLLESSKPGITLDVANRMYVQKQMKVKPEFKDILEKKYRTTSALVDFSKHEEVRLEINAWVEDQTREKIKNLIAQGILNSLTRMVLVNAIYFKGDWATKFDPKATEPGDFYIDSKKHISIDMMHANEKFGIGQNDELKCQILELPYINQTLSMFIILPYERDGLKSLEDKLTVPAIYELITDINQRKVQVTMPKFRLEGSLSLSDTLAAMGMPHLFSSRDADLSGITGAKGLYVSAILHKAFLEVNEEGSEAAAATAAVIMLRSLPRPEPPFTVDHPFLLIIKDNVTGCVLFWGRVVNPSSASGSRDEL